MKPTKIIPDNLGISNNRMNHILAVARRCYQIAKDDYRLSEEDCQKAFLIGFLHDIGYEFTADKASHPVEGYNLLTRYCSDDITTPIKTHGNPNIPNPSIMYLILNEADMTIDGKGNLVTMSERLEDVKERLGGNSGAYRDCVKMCTLIQREKDGK